MKKQSLAQGTLILIVAGFFTKILGMVNRIIVTRLLGEGGVGLYMLIMPTMMLLSTIATIGLPVAIPTLIARAKQRQKKILSTSLIIAIICSFLLCLVILITAKPLAIYLLKDERTYLPLLSLAPLLFVVSISSILKGYFQGEQNMYPTAISTFIEQVVRIIFCVIFIVWLLPYGIVYAVVGTLWASVLGELASVIILIFMFIKNMKYNHPNATLKPVTLDFTSFKDVLSISLPATGSRLIGSFTHFLEPIIVVQCLFLLGYTSEKSASMYGAVAGFAMPLLLMPSFISVAISQSIIPSISQSYINRQFDRIHYHLNTSFKFSFLPAGIATVIFMLFPYELMRLLFATDTGAEYLFIMAPFFLILYFQGTLTASLQAVNEATKAMTTTLISSIIKVIMMFILLCIPSINIYGLVIAILFNIVFTTTWHFLIVRKKIKYKANFGAIINGALIVGIVYILGRYLCEAFTFSANVNLNMFIIIIILSFAYVLLLKITNLLPQSLKKS